jgi:hypothetical protein
MVRKKHKLEMAATQSRITEHEEDVQARRVTDNKWFGAVADVRARMLDEMEEQAYALELNTD